MNDSARPITPSAIEIGKLLAIADRDLGQASMVSLHLDTRFALAYNAALQLATVVLRLRGIRIRKVRFHERTFQELESQLPSGIRTFADYFDRARRKRNVLSYDHVNVASAGEVEDLIGQVRAFGAWVTEEVGRSNLASTSSGCSLDGSATQRPLSTE